MSSYIQAPRNNTFAPVSAFQKQMVLNTVPRDQEAERLALTYLNKKAPDLVGIELAVEEQE